MPRDMPVAGALAHPYGDLADAFLSMLPADRVVTDPLIRLAWGTDASFYRLTPEIVVVVNTEDEVIRVLSACREAGVSVTFRAAGTSLSGQAVTDSVLVVLGDGWRGIRVEDEGRRIALGPAVIGAEANARLLPYNRKIGPDPASINAAKIGGIAANNASGMCCGTAQNSYRTLAGMRLILADGTLVDTDDADSVAAFRDSHAALLDELSRLAAAARDDEALHQRIKDKFKLKNTTGYSINALVDFDDPLDILTHLMIGSEGTLGFLSEIRYHTVPEPPHKATALILFPTLDDAANGVSALTSAPVSAVELVDRAGLHSVEAKPGLPGAIRDVPEAGAALLVDCRAEDPATLNDHIAAVNAALNGIEIFRDIAFTHDPAEIARLWDVRKGLFPSVGAMRQTGTTVIIEDVAFPVARLAEATRGLQALFEKHGYTEAIIFGHALEGNLHFVFTQGFDDPAEVKRYAAFMDDVADLVVDGFDGSLKSEHGTGRNMAPFVEKEWGAQAVDLMRRIKAALDPDGRLNPGVVLNDDPEIHLKHLKPLPKADPVVDKCIECGFCEPRCPSHGMSFSPRQRIVAWREINRLEAAGETRQAEIYRALYAYPGIDTCAADGLCATSCPVEINTGTLMKRLRAPRRSKLDRRLGRWIADNFALVIRLTRFGLGAADLSHRLLGAKTMTALSKGAHKMLGTPLWTAALPRPVKPRLRPSKADGETVVYFPACPSRGMGPPRGAEGDALPDVTIRLLEKAGYRVVIPDGVDRLCCGMPFESKGLFDTADGKTDELAAALDQASEGGKHPIVTDTSPCAWRFKAAERSKLQVQDLAAFLHDAVLARLDITPIDAPIAIHPTCSDRKMGTLPKLEAIAKACAPRAVIPARVECCGFAGDKGFSHPELNAHALRFLKDGIPDGATEGVSTSRTCEIGLMRSGGIPYQSVALLLDRVSRQKD